MVVVVPVPVAVLITVVPEPVAPEVTVVPEVVVVVVVEFVNVPVVVPLVVPVPICSVTVPVGLGRLFGLPREPRPCALAPRDQMHSAISASSIRSLGV